ncbi:hypothetical protein KHA80_22765 [Anaerobacillus sp. HL2]|nr:hypothetical protein KHA80_22765 [Anaerobacillus sp. HL2]
MWGESSVLDISKLPNELKTQFESFDRGSSVLAPDLLKQAFLQELPIDYVEKIKGEMVD